MKITANKILTIWDWVRYLSILAAIIFTAVACFCSFCKPFEVELDVKKAAEQQEKDQSNKRIREGKGRKSDKEIKINKTIPDKNEPRISNPKRGKHR